MITVSEIEHGRFAVTLGERDWGLLRTIAAGYSMPITEALAFCVNKGLTIGKSMLDESTEHDKLAEDRDIHFDCCTS